MPLKMAVHIDNRLFDILSIKRFRIADPSNYFGYLPGSVFIQGSCFFLVNQIPDLLVHLIFHRYKVTIEHVLEILVEIVM